MKSSWRDKDGQIRWLGIKTRLRIRNELGEGYGSLHEIRITSHHMNSGLIEFGVNALKDGLDILPLFPLHLFY